MPKGDLTLKIDAALAESLRARAKATGLSVEAYALGILQSTACQSAGEQPGFGENEASWTDAVVHDPGGEGFRQRDAAYWRELEAICDEADRTGGVPWEQVEARLLSFGQKR